MKIVEREIFDFIFFPEALDKEKFIFLSTTDLFDNELELLLDIKEKYEKNIPLNIIEKIKSKLTTITSNSIIRLEKKKVPLQYSTDHLVLAADSQLKNTKQKIQTFEDADSIYLIKLIEDEELTKIYLFTRNNKEIHPVKIKLEPSGEYYIFENQNKPIIITEKQQITGISLSTSY